jgi:hypothetical protein
MKSIIIRDSMGHILVKIKQLKTGGVMSEVDQSIEPIKITCVMDNNERIILNN